MNLRDYATVMSAYSMWMNDRLFAVAAELTDAERKRDLGAFFGSLHATLDHILLGDEAWMQRFCGTPVLMKDPREERFPVFEEMRAARRAMDERIQAWASTLDPVFADTPFRFFSVTYDCERVLPGWAAVVHMFNHQTHHRGQATTLLKQLGKAPGITDLPMMPLFDA